MKEEYYKQWFIKDNDRKISFYSIGTKGKILKRVEITQRGSALYDFAFGDVKADGSIDDIAITNNGDIIKIFATIFQIIKYYLEKYQNRELYFTGSTDVRTRLYRIVIGNNLQELSGNYIIFGLDNNFIPHPFERNNEYCYFIIKNK